MKEDCEALNPWKSYWRVGLVFHKWIWAEEQTYSYVIRYKTRIRVHYRIYLNSVSKHKILRKKNSFEGITGVLCQQNVLSSVGSELNFHSSSVNS